MFLDNIIALFIVLSTVKCFIQHNAITLFKGIELKKIVAYVLVLALFIQIALSLTVVAQIQPSYIPPPSDSWQTPLYIIVLFFVVIGLVIVGVIILIVYPKRKDNFEKPIKVGNYCSYCGSQVDAGVLFCKNCGKKL